MNLDMSTGAEVVDDDDDDDDADDDDDDDDDDVLRIDDFGAGSVQKAASAASTIDLNISPPYS